MDKKKTISTIVINAAITSGLDYAFALVTQTAPKVVTAIKNPAIINAATEAIKHDYLTNPLNLLSSAVHSVVFVKAQPLFIGIFAFLTIKKLWGYRKHKVEDASDYGSGGTSRFAKAKEIFGDIEIANNLGIDGTLLAMYKGKPIVLKDTADLNQHVAIIGGSGSGKSVSYVMPNVLKIKDKSIVVIDPKGTLYEKTSAVKRAEGFQVRLINFVDPHVSDRHNPLDYIRKETDALDMAQTLLANSGEVKRDFWDKAEESLLSAFILYVKYVLPAELQHFGSVFNLITSDYETIENTFTQLDRSHIARRAYMQSMSKLKDKSRDGVFSSLSVSVDLWKYDEVRNLTYTSDFKLSDIANEKTILYIVMPIKDKRFRPIVSTFVDQLLSEFYLVANQNKGKLPVPVRCVFDEFNNVGKLSSFEETVSTVREMGVGISMIIQSIGQLEQRYGKLTAEEIMANCDTILFLGTNSLSSCEYFSKLLGDTTVRVASESQNRGDKSRSEGRSYSNITRPLRKPDELRRMGRETAYVFIRGKYPFDVNKARYYNIKQFAGLSDLEVSRFDYPTQDRGGYKEYIPEASLTVEPSKKLSKPNLRKKTAKTKPQAPLKVEEDDLEFV
jgi:type IV secretion system protein VirD4